MKPVDATEVLQELDKLKVSVALDGGHLVLRPASRVPHDLVRVLKQSKSELVEHLRRREAIEDTGLTGPWIEVQEALAINCRVCSANKWWLRTRGGGEWMCGACHPEP